MTSKIKVNILADGGDNSIITSDGAGSFTASSGLASSVQSVGDIQNTPSFYAYRSSGQSISANTVAKLNFNVELYDTNNAYDNSTNYRFTVPSGQGGKYYIGAFSRITNFTASRIALIIRQNTTDIVQGEFGNDGSYQTLFAYTIGNLSSGDYLELYGYQNSGSSQMIASGDKWQTGFFAYKLIGA